jgi:hypothetical protein
VANSIFYKRLLDTQLIKEYISLPEKHYSIFVLL